MHNANMYVHVWIPHTERRERETLSWKQCKANRKSSPENCLLSILNHIQKCGKRHTDKRGGRRARDCEREWVRERIRSAFDWASYCRCVLFFSIFFWCVSFSHSLCTNHCSDCFNRNSKRRQTKKKTNSGKRELVKRQRTNANNVHPVCTLLKMRLIHEKNVCVYVHYVRVSYAMR